MMRTILKSLLLTSVLSLPLASVAAEGDSIETKVSDAVLTTKVKAAFAADDKVEALDIKVDTDHDGMVQLSGNANTEAEAEKAVRLAKSVKGVTGVKDNIKVNHEEH
jgi:hyperosmotically inducible periplasmic protein